jgi:flagellin
MTIWFSTNIPEMRAISTFNRVSTDISEIQHRITTGQRINSGKDDPGGLIIREGLRADIKSINAAQAGMTQAEVMMEAAASGMQQLIEIINGNPTDPSSSGLLKMLDDPLLDLAQKGEMARDFMNLYDSVVNTTMYNEKKLIGGDITAKTYQLGDGTGTLSVTIADLSSANVATNALTAPTGAFTDQAAVDTFRADVAETLGIVSKAYGDLGMKQQIAATNQRLLDSRLTSVTASEGRISNADIAVESSRMARAELLAQNAMTSISYTRNYAAFAVSSLFR